jgi:hypothetical protein
MATLLRTMSAAEAALLTEQVAAAIEHDISNFPDFPGIGHEANAYLLARTKQFQTQAEFLTNYDIAVHPCIMLGEHAVPLEFAPRSLPMLSEQQLNATMLADILSVDAGTRVDMESMPEVKRTFAQRVVEFVGAAMERFGGGGGGGGNDDGGPDFDGETEGLEVVVNASTHGLQVVYSEHFMIRGKRSENAFGESLTSPVRGRITQPGLYYFGTADNEQTKWARFTFRIPPTRIVNLMH